MAGHPAFRLTPSGNSEMIFPAHLPGKEEARYLRDAKAGQIYEGTNKIMQLIIAREVLKGGAA